jgi:hypothetical protein
LHFVIHNLRWLFIVAAFFIFIAFGFFFFLRRKPLPPDELERRRRARLNRIGRITSGQVTGIIENTPEARSARAQRAPVFRRKDSTAAVASVEKLLCYVYSVSGVRYETAQNVAGLEDRVSFSRMVAGQPASVKYDPASPGNSILVADDWSGFA